MSYKTDRLVALFPEVYAAPETESLLYKLLDALGAELMEADEAIKALLKSHWVDYAGGAGLDGLGAIYGVSRRLVIKKDEQESASEDKLEPESDEGFRQRLKSIVPLFTGGGTKRAVIGAVRSALGLPFDLEQLKLPPEFKALRDDLEKLVYIEEFSPKGERVVNNAVTEVGNASELILEVKIPSVEGTRPVIQWKFSSGGGRMLSVELLGSGAGVKSKDSLIMPSGKTLTLSADGNGKLNAALDLTDLTSQFTNLDGTAPAILPQVPAVPGGSKWKFRAKGGQFDVSLFDRSDTFNLPRFEVEMNWLRYVPLTFDVHMPYFLQKAVDDLAKLHNYKGKLFVFAGLPLSSIPEIVNQTRAAGVRGSVQFSLNNLEVHNQDEKFILDGLYSVEEKAGADESFIVSSVNDVSEFHDAGERFVIGGVFDISTFDRQHGFQA